MHRATRRRDDACPMRRAPSPMYADSPHHQPEEGAHAVQEGHAPAVRCSRRAAIGRRAPHRADVRLPGDTRRASAVVIGAAGADAAAGGRPGQAAGRHAAASTARTTAVSTLTWGCRTHGPRPSRTCVVVPSTPKTSVTALPQPTDRPGHRVRCTVLRCGRRRRLDNRSRHFSPARETPRSTPHPRGCYKTTCRCQGCGNPGYRTPC